MERHSKNLIDQKTCSYKWMYMHIKDSDKIDKEVTDDVFQAHLLNTIQAK